MSRFLEIETFWRLPLSLADDGVPGGRAACPSPHRLPQPRTVTGVRGGGASPHRGPRGHRGSLHIRPQSHGHRGPNEWASPGAVSAQGRWRQEVAEWCLINRHDSAGPSPKELRKIRNPQKESGLRWAWRALPEPSVVWINSSLKSRFDSWAKHRLLRWCLMWARVVDKPFSVLLKAVTGQGVLAGHETASARATGCQIQLERRNARSRKHAETGLCRSLSQTRTSVLGIEMIFASKLISWGYFL